MKKSRHLTVAITGIFGSGKSAVAAMFRKEGIPVVSADSIVDELLQTPEIIRKISASFNSVSAGVKGLDRARLADEVFTDIEKREKLEEIIHPLVFKRIGEAVLDLKQEHDIIAVEIPLLFETKSENMFDVVITVIAYPDIIKRRLKRFSPEDIERRWNNQLPLRKKEEMSDFVVDNSHSLEKTSEQVHELIGELRKDTAASP